MIHVFFFSSRRRHTRSLCDWSSDVCSSDLDCGEAGLHERGWRGQGPARRVDQGKRSSVIFHARLLRIRYVMLSWDETECGEAPQLITPRTTSLASPPSHTSSYAPSAVFRARLSSRLALLVQNVTGSLARLQSASAHAAATAPVPHANVSSSTPRS